MADLPHAIKSFSVTWNTDHVCISAQTDGGMIVDLGCYDAGDHGTARITSNDVAAAITKGAKSAKRA